ncbi:MAG: METTL5 family protein [Nanoarchaeota archaeon]|nr:METTL5 family protein [Nanoarchaeota archaeon]
MITKSQLAIQLSKLRTFTNPILKLEQYATDSETAAEIIWTAYLDNDIENRTIADLGSGTGVLAYGCLILGAKKVYLVEKDKEANKIASHNLSQFKNFKIIKSDIKDFRKKVDIVIQNPPFGTKTIHADREFLKKAMQVSKKIYSLHKTSTKDFISTFAKKNNFRIKRIISFSHPIKQTYKHHKKSIHRTKVSCFVLEKISCS